MMSGIGSRKTPRLEAQPSTEEPSRKRAHVGEFSTSLLPPGFAPVPPGSFSQCSAPGSCQLPCLSDRECQTIPPTDASPVVIEEAAPLVPESDSLNLLVSIAKAVMSYVANRSFIKGTHTPLNEDQIQDIRFLLTLYKNEEQEVDEKDIEKLANLTVEIKAIDRWDILGQGKKLAEVEQLLQNYRPEASKVWEIAIYGNNCTPLRYLNYYKYYEFLKTDFSDRLPLFERMPQAPSYRVAYFANKEQNPEEKVKIFDDELEKISSAKEQTKKTQVQSTPMSQSKKARGQGASLNRARPSLRLNPTHVPFSLPVLAGRDFKDGTRISLNEDEIKELSSLLAHYKNEEQESSQQDLEKLANLTVEIKAIDRQKTFRQGEKLAEVEQLLQNYRPEAFSSWLIAIYRNKHTPKNYLSYYKFYSSLSASRPDLCPKFRSMPISCVYALAGKEGNDTKKIEIIEKWNPAEKGREAEKKLREEIHDVFGKYRRLKK